MPTGFALNTDPVDRLLKRYEIRNIKAPLTDGLEQAGHAIVRDAIEVSPTVPIDLSGRKGSTRGALRRSWSVHVDPQGRFVAVSFNMPYAARWHETEEDIQWTEPTAGAKYLEFKLARFRTKYMGIVGNVLSEGLR